MTIMWWLKRPWHGRTWISVGINQPKAPIDLQDMLIRQLEDAGASACCIPCLTVSA